MKITNIEVVTHSYHKLTGGEFWSVLYSSGRLRSFTSWGLLPETVKAFVRSHYDIVFCDNEYRTVYSYRAINRIR